MTGTPITRRQAMTTTAALTMGVVVAPPVLPPAPAAPIRWKLYGRLGDHVGWRVVVTRAAWQAMPADTRPDAWLDDSGAHVTYETQLGKDGGS